jgi:hypothetical protein
VSSVTLLYEPCSSACLVSATEFKVGNVSVYKATNSWQHSTHDTHSSSMYSLTSFWSLSIFCSESVLLDGLQVALSLLYLVSPIDLLPEGKTNS